MRIRDLGMRHRLREEPLTGLGSADDLNDFVRALFGRGVQVFYWHSDSLDRGHKRDGAIISPGVYPRAVIRSFGLTVLRPEGLVELRPWTPEYAPQAKSGLPTLFE
jgi:hypothetical protein